MRYDAPLVLYAAPLVAALMLGLALWGRAARVRHARRWSGELARTARDANRGVALWLGLVTLLAMAALAGPRWGRQLVTTDTRALDLVIAVDLSLSMLAEDVEPSRLVRARRQVRRLVHDLQGDRLGLVGFAGRSFILSPLTVDGSALHLLVDALHPDMVSAGGSALGGALRQGRELLQASERLADRVLVMFTDGEAHDALSAIVAAAERLRRDGIRLILVGEGGTDPVRIPLRSPDGELTGYHRDLADNDVLTMRRDDILMTIADAAQGALVAAEMEDQAGAVRDLVLSYKRAPESSTAAMHDIPRGWLPLLAAVLVLLVVTVTRPTAALIGLVLAVGWSAGAQAQAPRNAADEAWRDGEFARAAHLYELQARAGEGGDTARYNAGTAQLAAGRLELARRYLERAAETLDPEIRFRALYNLGLSSLRSAGADSANADAHLADARARYREALMLRPGDRDAKWNLELAITTPPQGGGVGQGAAPPTPQGREGPDVASARPPMSLTREQAEQILQSIAAEERRTRLNLSRRAGQVRDARREKDW